MHRYFVCYFLVQVIMQIIITSNKLYMPWKKILIFVCLLVIQLFVCTQYLEDFLVYVLHDLEGYIWFNNLRRTLLYFYCDQFFFLYSSSLHIGASVCFYYLHLQLQDQFSCVGTWRWHKQNESGRKAHILLPCTRNIAHGKYRGPRQSYVFR